MERICIFVPSMPPVSAVFGGWGSCQCSDPRLLLCSPDLVPPGDETIYPRPETRLAMQDVLERDHDYFARSASWRSACGLPRERVELTLSRCRVPAGHGASLAIRPEIHELFNSLQDRLVAAPDMDDPIAIALQQR
ncbi:MULTISPECIES: hypothetical protein [unclassified Bradyrhizobium]|uniref:hypothetical protein n=1 Tax=unclassified Bradyrhizobium TaxID=2631580 RepID=UPI0028E56C47|nr:MULTISPECIES: hypothetical protein [unclassified Bradyrhizobium]